jgi:hypothetical protein
LSENIEQTRVPRSGFGWTLRLKPVPVVGPTPAPSPPVPTCAATLAPAMAARIQQRIADLAFCRDRFPVLFDMTCPQPLAIGVDKRLAALIGDDRAGFLLAWWTRWPAYVAAVAAGGRRYHLDGSEAGEISEEHRRTAAGKWCVARAVP